MVTYFSNVSQNLFLGVLTAVLVTAVSALVGYVLYTVMKKKGFRQSPAVQMILSGTIGLALFLRFGLSVTLLQGSLLFFVLLYASLSDLTRHEADDFIWVIVLALSLVSIPRVGLFSMTAGAVFVMLPQLALAILPPHKTVGGADIKLSTALAFLLGAASGICAYMIGLTVAVIFMTVYNRHHDRCPKKPFALIPFLSMAAMAVFFI